MAHTYLSVLSVILSVSESNSAILPVSKTKIAAYREGAEDSCGLLGLTRSPKKPSTRC